jgi:hypothetical protein
MTSDIDIYRSANVFINRYGKDAIKEAYRHYDTVSALGDDEGIKLWHRIIEAIEWLQSDQKPNDIRSQ